MSIGGGQEGTKEKCFEKVAGNSPGQKWEGLCSKNDSQLLGIESCLKMLCRMSAADTDRRLEAER